VKWAREILQHSPLAIRCLKSAFNADVDGQAGIQELAGNATLLYYMTGEAREFHQAQREKRRPMRANTPGCHEPGVGRSQGDPENTGSTSRLPMFHKYT